MIMKEVRGNIFDFIGRCDAICITTNGNIKSNGEAVMGKGVALTAKQNIPSLPIHLANHLKENGNHVGRLGKCMINKQKTWVVSFPTKNDWRDKSDINLIEQSTKELVNMANEFGWEQIYIPRPGCNNGQLNWGDVKKVLLKHFDDRFYIITL